MCTLASTRKLTYSRDSPTFAKQFCKESPDSPTFAKHFREDSPYWPTFAKQFCEDSPNSRVCKYWPRAFLRVLARVAHEWLLLILNIKQNIEIFLYNIFFIRTIFFNQTTEIVTVKNVNYKMILSF